jgi:hypothetical protein
MARGRALNLSLPPTRALTQQRDFRARKAAQIASLERTNKELGDDVDNLRRELVEVKEGKGRDGDTEQVSCGGRDHRFQGHRMAGFAEQNPPRRCCCFSFLSDGSDSSER